MPLFSLIIAPGVWNVKIYHFKAKAVNIFRGEIQDLTSVFLR